MGQEKNSVGIAVSAFLAFRTSAMVAAGKLMGEAVPFGHLRTALVCGQQSADSEASFGHMRSAMVNAGPMLSSSAHSDGCQQFGHVRTAIVCRDEDIDGRSRAPCAE